MEETLNPIHRRIARLAIQGVKNKDIAVAMNLTEAWVSTVKSKTDVCLYMEKLCEDVDVEFTDKMTNDELKGMRGMATEVIMSEIMSPISTARRLNAAFGLLDRTGHPKTQALEIAEKPSILRLTPEPGEDIEDFKKRRDEAITLLAEKEKKEG